MNLWIDLFTYSSMHLFISNTVKHVWRRPHYTSTLVCLSSQYRRSGNIIRAVFHRCIQQNAPYKQAFLEYSVLGLGHHVLSMKSTRQSWQQKGLSVYKCVLEKRNNFSTTETYYRNTYSKMHELMDDWADFLDINVNYRGILWTLLNKIRQNSCTTRKITKFFPTAKLLSRINVEFQIYIFHWLTLKNNTI